MRHTFGESDQVSLHVQQNRDRDEKGPQMLDLGEFQVVLGEAFSISPVVPLLLHLREGRWK